MAVRTSSRQVGKRVYYYAKTDDSVLKGGEIIAITPTLPSESLPDEFTNYLRVLFNILDSKGRGFVRLSDIEQRWCVGESGALPAGIISSLRSVASKNGLLTFENLCSGLKLALRGQSNDLIDNNANGILKSSRLDSQDDITSPIHTVKAVPIQVGSAKEDNPQLRASSLPQLNSTDSACTRVEEKRRGAKKERVPSFVDRLRVWHHDRRQPAEKLTKINQSGNEEGALLGGQTSPSLGVKNGGNLNRSQSDTKVFYDSSPDSQRKPTSVNIRKTKHLGPKKEAKLQQLEEDNTILQEGKDVIEKARRWFFQRITTVQEERLHILESENFSPQEAHYEMLMDKNRREELHLTPEDFEVYKNCVKKLSEQVSMFVNDPKKMVSQHQDSPEAKKIRNLEEANKKLEQELKEKNEKIVQLESDKQSLIKEIFDSKSRRGRPRPLSASRVKAW